MTQGPIPDFEVVFRHEYVSGIVEVFVVAQHGGQGGLIKINATNAGHRNEAARIVLIGVHDFPHGVVALDSGNRALEPMEVMSESFLIDKIELTSRYWCRIFTTSDSVVPTMLAVDPFVPEKPADFGSVEQAQPERRTYYAPGDFAHFVLPYRVVPPIGQPGGTVER